MRRIGVHRTAVRGERLVVPADSLFEDLAHLEKQRRCRRPLARERELGAVGFDQILPAPGLVVEPSEARQRGRVRGIDFHRLATERERDLVVRELDFGDFTGAQEDLDATALVGRERDLELERGDELLKAPTPFGRALHRVNRAEVLGFALQDAAVGGERLSGFAERVFVEAPDLEEPGGLALDVRSEIDGALVELGELGELRRAG